MNSIALCIAIVTIFGLNKPNQTPDKVQPPLVKQQADQKKKKWDVDFVGLTVAQAKKLAKARGLYFRATIIDGKHQLLRDNWEPKRVNAVIVKGKVTKTSRG